MSIQASGQISVSQIRSFLNRSGQFSFSQLYNKLAGSPTSGTIKVSDCFGKTHQAARYPPVSMGGNTSTLSGLSYGNGTYYASGSSLYPGYDYYWVFTDDYNQRWYSATGVYSYVAGTKYGDYIGGQNKSGTGYNGEWLMLQLPLQVMLKSYVIDVSTINREPVAWRVYGSNNGTSWTLLSDVSISIQGYDGVTYDTTANTSYFSIYLLVINRIYLDNGSYNYAHLQKWWLNGYV